MDLLAVAPRPEDEVHAIVAHVLGLDGLVHRDVAVDVLLVPQTVHQHHRHGQRTGREDPVHRLVPPEGVVVRVGQELAPEPHLLHAVAAAVLARRARLHELVVLVEVARPPLLVVGAGRLLLVDVGHVLLAESAVVEPVVAEPAVHHRVHGYRHPERRVGVDERHQGREAVVGDAEDADPAVGLRHVLDEPVDGVPGVGGVVDGRRVLRPAHRPVHDVVALGAILATNVLDDPDVAAVDDHVHRVIVAVEHRREAGAVDVGGQRGGVIGRPGQQHRRALGALRHQDDGVQPDAVPHGDHHVAPGEVEAVGHRREARRGFARQLRDRRLRVGRRRLGRGGRCHERCGDEQRDHYWLERRTGVFHHALSWPTWRFRVMTWPARRAVIVRLRLEPRPGKRSVTARLPTSEVLGGRAESGIWNPQSDLGRDVGNGNGDGNGDGRAGGIRNRPIRTPWSVGRAGPGTGTRREAAASAVGRG